MTTAFQVTISLKRVQSFIFEVPRLKAMLGANALIGHTMRHDLRELARGMACGLEWPKDLPRMIPDDPLSNSADPDDPALLFGEGVLARDGGHFIAVFGDGEAAQRFVRAAEERLASNLPGVMFEAKLAPFGHWQDSSAPKEPRAATEIHLLDLPVLQVCQETGSGVASEEGDKGGWVGRSVAHRTTWSKKFRDGRTRDVVGLMRDELYTDQAMDWAQPNDLEELASGEYLAVIHADGNRIGSRHLAWMQTAPADPVANEAHGQAFFHSMRVAVRRSLVTALRQTFTCRGNVRPFEILMLGGDDLLLACRADKALEFAGEYAEALKGHTLPDGHPVDVAIGVAIARHTYPLHRLQELAEDLAGSAKRLYRALPDDRRTSVVDWQVVTQSWFAGVAEVRQATERVKYKVDGNEETLLLTNRPYRITGDGASLDVLLRRSKALDVLLRRSKALSGIRAARSKLRGLRAACRSGRLAGQAAFDGLDGGIRAMLGDELWRRLDSKDVHCTSVLDTVGVVEIARLGRTRQGRRRDV